MRTPSTPTETVREFRTGLAAFVGRFVRIHTVSGEVRQGILVSVPEVFVGVDDDGDLIVRGNYVLDGPASYVGKIEDMRTYDVLPRRSPVSKGKARGRKGPAAKKSKSAKAVPSPP